MRLDSWEKNLFAYLKTVGPFEWGTNDCCLFAANAVEVMTGIDPAKKYRGYKTKFGAAKKLKNTNIEEAWTEVFGESIHPKMAKRGDVILFQVGKEQSVGVCVGTTFAAISEEGLVMFPMTQAIMGWRV
jgi:hypothetical protein